MIGRVSRVTRLGFTRGRRGGPIGPGRGRRGILSARYCAFRLFRMLRLVSARRLVDQALAAGAAAMGADHVGLGPGLVDADQPGGIDPALASLPLPPPSGHVRAVLLAGVKRLFSYVSPSRRRNRLSIERSARTLRSLKRRSDIAARVIPGSATRTTSTQSRSGARTEGRWPAAMVCGDVRRHRSR